MRREETWVHGGTVSTEKCGLGPKSEQAIQYLA
jgi:hypothetical protein